MITLCSTGLSTAERKALQVSIDVLSGACYDGDLTDRTTHLIAKPGQQSEKLKVARGLGLPIVLPAWLHDSAAAGTKLLPLVPKYVVQDPEINDENTSLNSANRRSSNHRRSSCSSVGTSCSRARTGVVLSCVRDPLPLLRESTSRGELSFDPQEPLAPSLQTITLCGEEYSLDAPTGFLRQHGLSLAAAGKRAWSSGNGGGEGRAGRASGALLAVPSHSTGTGRAYTLRELLFALRCAGKAHADYFLACVAAEIEPVLLLDKQLLVSSVMPSSTADDAEEESISAAGKGVGSDIGGGQSSFHGSRRARCSSRGSVHRCGTRCATMSTTADCDEARGHAMPSIATPIEAAAAAPLPPSRASSCRLSSAPTMRMQLRTTDAPSALPIESLDEAADRKESGDEHGAWRWTAVCDRSSTSPAPSSAREPSSAPDLASEERAALLRKLQQAAEDREALNAQVQQLTATLHDERLKAAGEECQYY